MYPMEYRWISVPMPVTNRHMVIDSGSTRKPKSTWRPPTGSHSKSVWVYCALLGAFAAEGDEHDDGGEERAADRGGGEPAGERLADAAAERPRGTGSPRAAARG